MRLQPLILSFILISGCALGTFLYYADVVVNYAPSDSLVTNQSSEYYQRFNNTLTSLGAEMTGVENKTRTEGVDLGGVGDVTSLFLSVTKTLFALPSIMRLGVDNILYISGAPYIPPWFSPLIIIVIFTVIALSVAAILFKRDEI